MSGLRPEADTLTAPQPAAAKLRLAGAPTKGAAPDAGRDTPPRARGRVRLIAGADVLALVAAGAGTWGVAEAIAPPAVVGPTWAVALLCAASLLMWLGLFSGYRLYERQTRGIAPASFDEVSTLFSALLAGSLLLSLAGQVLRRLTEVQIYTPLEAVIFLGLAIVAIPTARGAVRTWLMPNVLRPRRTLIVGAGTVGRLVERKIQAHPEYGLELVGFVDDESHEDAEHLLGHTEDLTRLVDELGIDRVILAPSSTPHERLLELVRAVRRPDVHMTIVPNYFELFASNATIEDIEGMPVVSLPPMRMSRSARFLKRGFDIAASGAGLLALSPLLAVTALAIKLDSRGPVFFRQLRNGRGGERFSIVKFRTMVDGAEGRRFELAHLNELSGPLFKIAEDPRITRVGGFLRRYSIDELPQLWNVLRGDMSLVGPRPFVVHEADQITGWAGRRLESTPGITGLWQVLGRNDIPFDEMVKLDYIYVTNWSLWWDVKILCQTIPVVLARRGAY